MTTTKIPLAIHRAGIAGSRHRQCRHAVQILVSRSLWEGPSTSATSSAAVQHRRYVYSPLSSSPCPIPRRQKVHISSIHCQLGNPPRPFSAKTVVINIPDTRRKVEGVIRRIIFSKDGYYICKLKEASGEEVKIVGKCDRRVNVGDSVQVWGTHENHFQYGEQLTFHQCKLIPSIDIDNNDEKEAIENINSSSKDAAQSNEDPAGMAAYLEAKVPTLGPILVQRIVLKFGMDTLDIIKDDPDQLLEVEGIGEGRIISIKQAFEKEEHDTRYRDVLLLLGNFGVTAQRCRRISQEFSAEDIKKNPYCMVSIHGTSFGFVDKIAFKLGIARNSPLRLEVCILDALRTKERNGDTATLQHTLLSDLRKDLYGFGDRKVVELQLSEMVGKDLFKRVEFKNDIYLQLPEHSSSESDIAVHLKSIQNTKLSSLPRKARDFTSHEKIDDNILELSSQQQDAVRNALSNKVSIITGGPGTGKTSIIKALVQKVRGTNGTIILAAPTGMAARRMQEATDHEAQTIHRLLKWSDGTFVHDKYNKLSADIVVIDEASMKDAYIASCLLRAIPDTSHIAIVGDIDQLPSVGPGNVLKDIISSEMFSVSRLDFNFRQTGASTSSIVKYAHAANNGDASLPTPFSTARDLSARDQFQFLEVDDAKEVAPAVNQIYTFIKEVLEKDPLAEAQILVPRHKGDAGRETLNLVLQESQNNATEIIKFGHKRFKLGDKVMQIRNDYDKLVFNGEVGIITSFSGGDQPEQTHLPSKVEEDSKEEYGSSKQIVTVDFGDRSVSYSDGETSDLTLAYATTIHKSQGSEYPIIAIVLMHEHGHLLLKRNLVYTAITRGKERVIIVGERSAYKRAVADTKYSERCTLLPYYLGKHKSLE